MCSFLTVWQFTLFYTLYTYHILHEYKNSMIFNRDLSMYFYYYWIRWTLLFFVHWNPVSPSPTKYQKFKSRWIHMLHNFKICRCLFLLSNSFVKSREWPRIYKYLQKVTSQDKKIHILVADGGGVKFNVRREKIREQINVNDDSDYVTTYSRFVT